MIRNPEFEFAHERPAKEGSWLSRLTFPASFLGGGLITVVIVGLILLIYSG
jgi:hypothetical protein